jgi:tetratricopeptide (TPR) repeat protein
MLCKESGAFVPAAWLAAEVLLRPPPRPELLRRARPYFAYAAAVAAGIAMRALAFSPLTRPWMSPLNNPLVLVQGPARWLGAARNVFRYAASVIDPGYRLYACGVPDCGATSAGDWRAWLGLLIMAAIVAAPFFLRRRNPLAAAGLAWGAIFFLPVSSFFVAGPGYAERLLYLPFLGLSLAAAAGAKALGTAARRPALGWGLLAAFGVANLIAVQQRHLDWRSFAELSVADADRLPGNALLESIAAVHDFERHDATGALARAERALRLEPGNVLALQVKGLALDRLGRPAEAEQALLLAFEESGRAPPLTEDYVRFLLRHRRPAEARAALEKARAARPGENVLPQLDAEIERRR